MNPSIEQLSHFVCAQCKKWWTIGDALKNKKEWFCPWCGKKQSVQLTNSGEEILKRSSAYVQPEQKQKQLALSQKAKNIKPGTYKHFKGDIMEVVGVALHSETLEEFVVYKHKTGAHAGEKHYWIRPLNMFTETVELNGKKIKRFKRLAS